MRENDDILNLLCKQEAEAIRRARRGIILQPGAIGDCILTLPLVEFMKKHLQLGGVDILGHTEYVGILPGRSDVDSVRCIDSIDLHRLFAKVNEFELADNDPLIYFFAEYDWIVTFLGEPESNFEQNLIFTVNCSHSAEVITLSMKPPADFGEHLTDFYIQQFLSQSGLSAESQQFQPGDSLIRATSADIERGRELLEESGADTSQKLVVIAPGSGGTDKCWYLNNFLAVGKELISQGFEVVFLLGPAEMERFDAGIIEKIKKAGKCMMGLSLTSVLELLSCTDKFTGNDSGITHLAAALGVETAAIFGPTNSNIYRPAGKAVTVLANNEPTFTKEASGKMQQELLEVLRA